jgi:DNA-binding NtrC family response regulator
LFGAWIAANVPTVGKIMAARGETPRVSASGVPVRSVAQRARRVRQRSIDPAPRAKTVLWVDDYAPGLMVYSAILEKLGFQVITAFEARVGLEIASSGSIDAVITDYEMPEMNGGALTAALKSRYPQLPVILFTGSHSVPGDIKKLADACCDKAAPLGRLIAALNRLLIKKSTESPACESLRPRSEQGQRAVV